MSLRAAASIKPKKLAINDALPLEAPPSRRSLSLIYLFITPSQRQHRRTQTYKTRKIMHNKTAIKLQICSQRCGKRVCHCTFYTVSSCSRPDTILTAQKHEIGIYPRQTH